MPRYSAVISSLISRIQGHQVTGGILAGVKFVDIPVSGDPEGQSDLPVIRLFMPEIAEKQHEQMLIVGGTMTINFTLSTERSLGVPVHAQKLEAFMDALQMNGSAVDLLLGGSLSKPFEIKPHSPFIPTGGLSLNTHIAVTTTPIECASGGRR